uniref:Uncharacterized protein n=1 Tax=Arundo donax TaxID=35708 RepID=A0A0A9GHM4_ARUDO
MDDPFFLFFASPKSLPLWHNMIEIPSPLAHKPCLFASNLFLNQLFFPTPFHPFSIRF